MDLIYANEQKEDMGVLLDYSFDLAFGKDENDFELKVNRQNHCCEAGYFIYIEGTEYGGIVDAIEVDTEAEEVTYKGRTWHGILEHKVLCPNSGQDYLTVSGEANTIIGSLLSRVGLSDMFEASGEDSLIRITSYQFARYIDAYMGIRKMLVSVGAKLLFTYKDGKVVLSAVPLVDYSQDEQFDSDQVALKIQRTYNAINHVICLGSGNLKNRQVIHLYADENGNVSHTQSLRGIQEVVAVYDYANAESLEDLEAGGKEKIKESYAQNKVSMDFDAEGTVYDIDDIVGSKDIQTGIEVKESIAKKIVSINKGEININYKVGD
ncbi:hypothetical protein [Bacillus infantis]|uniref:hypothetical protein n=1 Tax=Bacillus infantis TaxID=324767 RepID=UPI003CFBBD3D